MDSVMRDLTRIFAKVDLKVMAAKAVGYDEIQRLLTGDNAPPPFEFTIEPETKPAPEPMASVSPVAAEASQAPVVSETLEAPEAPEEPDELEAVWPKPKPLPEAVSPVVPVPAEDPTPAQKRGRGRPKKSAPAEMPPDIEEPSADPVVAPGPIGALVVDGPADSPPAGDLEADPNADF